MQNGKPRISPETQYNQEYESWRQHDRFIWQIPTIVATVDVAAVGASFALNIPWWAREIIFFVNIIFTSTLTFALIKHRYFIDIEQDTLSALEVEYADKCIQRMTNPIDDRQYWAKKSDATQLQKFSAHRIFKWGMYLIMLALLALLVFNLPYGTSFWIIIPFIVFLSALSVVLLVFLKKNKGF
jgi:hypothetical protein